MKINCSRSFSNLDANLLFLNVEDVIQYEELIKNCCKLFFFWDQIFHVSGF